MSGSRRPRSAILLLCALAVSQILFPFSVGQPASFVYVLVHHNVFDSIKPEIDQYVKDIERDGLGAEVHEFTGGSAEGIRSTLASDYPRGLVGCLLVGDIPSAWYEMDVSYPLTPQVAHEEFPLDLFYMDLNGVWKDTDGDGIYNQHSGDRAPEIWVGRLKAPGMAEDEVPLLRNYFAKNHAYRSGWLKLPERALIYVDDFWGDMAKEYSSAVGAVFLNRTVVNDRLHTNPADYLNRLKEEWTLVHMMIHGSPTFHHFYVDNEEPEGDVMSFDIRQTDPRAFFYILISCWNARYTATDYMGGWYIFSKSYGLLAISSTKPGDMQQFNRFYSMCRDGNIGSAFRKWFADRIKDEDSRNEYTKKYFYGMIILGDPTLHMRPSYYPTLTETATTISIQHTTTETPTVTALTWTLPSVWSEVADGSLNLVGEEGPIVGDLGQPYVDLASVAYGQSDQMLCFRFNLNGEIPNKPTTANVDSVWYQVLFDVDSDPNTGFHWSSDFTPDYILDLEIRYQAETTVTFLVAKHSGTGTDWSWTSIRNTERSGSDATLAGGIGQDSFVLACRYQDISASEGSQIRFFARSGILCDGKVYNDFIPDKGAVTVTLSDVTATVSATTTTTSETTKQLASALSTEMLAVVLVIIGVVLAGVILAFRRKRKRQ